MAVTYDYQFKVLLLGDSGVGKTCIMFRFSEDAFSSTYITSIGKTNGLDVDVIEEIYHMHAGKPFIKYRYFQFQCNDVEQTWGTPHACTQRLTTSHSVRTED